MQRTQPRTFLLSYFIYRRWFLSCSLRLCKSIWLSASSRHWRLIKLINFISAHSNWNCNFRCFNALKNAHKINQIALPFSLKHRVLLIYLLSFYRFYFVEIFNMFFLYLNRNENNKHFAWIFFPTTIKTFKFIKTNGRENIALVIERYQQM